MNRKVVLSLENLGKYILKLKFENVIIERISFIQVIIYEKKNGYFKYIFIHSFIELCQWWLNVLLISDIVWLKYFFIQKFLIKSESKVLQYFDCIKYNSATLDDFVVKVTNPTELRACLLLSECYFLDLLVRLGAQPRIPQF